MIDAIRRPTVWCMRHGFKLLAVFLVLGYGLSLLEPGPAVAVPEDAAIAKGKKVALGEGPLNKRLMALEEIRTSGSGEAAATLADIARKASIGVSSAACAQLGRIQSASAKAKLRGLLEDTSLDAKVRDAAASSIAVHWKDPDDIAYLEEKCSGNKRLEKRVAMLKTKVYGR